MEHRSVKKREPIFTDLPPSLNFLQTPLHTQGLWHSPRMLVVRFLYIKHMQICTAVVHRFSQILSPYSVQEILHMPKPLPLQSGVNVLSTARRLSHEQAPVPVLMDATAKHLPRQSRLQLLFVVLKHMFQVQLQQEEFVTSAGHQSRKMNALKTSHQINRFPLHQRMSLSLWPPPLKFQLMNQ